MKHLLSIIIVALSITMISCASTKPVPNPEIQKLKNESKTKDAKIAELKRQLDACRDSLGVYLFFNNEDVTIFTDNRLEQNGRINLLNSKKRTDYETIRLIRNVELGLNQVEQTIQETQKKQQVNNWSDKDLNDYIALTIKKEMYRIGDLLDVIINRDRSFLSDKQKEFYTKQSKRFRQIFNKYL